MRECIILFGHHKNCDVTRDHLRRLIDLNPCPVIPIHMNEAEHLDDALNLGKPDTGRENWPNADQFFIKFFNAGVEEAKRYFYFDWDVLVTVGVRKHYAKVWNHDAVAAQVLRYEVDADRKWHWFSEQYGGKLPPALKPHAAGIVPLNGVMLSHRCLSHVANQVQPTGVFSELRLATLIRAGGFRITELPWPENTWQPVTPDFRKPTIYHPVKELIEVPDLTHQ